MENDDLAVINDRAGEHQPYEEKPKIVKVKVVDIDLSFWRWICVMVKVIFAMIPAIIIINLIIALILTLTGVTGTILQYFNNVTP